MSEFEFGEVVRLIEGLSTELQRRTRKPGRLFPMAAKPNQMAADFGRRPDDTWSAG